MNELIAKTQLHEAIQASELNIGNELLQYIEVRSPYFALTNIRLNQNGYLSADIPVELKNHNEVPGISLAETGRHMAILGSLAMANSNPRKEKHYYLATDAIFERVHTLPTSTTGCKGIVKTDFIDKKQGVANGQLTNEFGDVIYNAEIRYAVIHEKIFERLFKDKMTETNSLFVGNPYAFPTVFYTDSVSESSCNASINIIRKEDCIGHFDNYPALPVARIGGVMTDVSGMHYNQIRKSDSKFCIRKAVLHAESFIFAGDSVKIFTQKGQSSPSEGLLIESFAQTNDKCNAVELKCWFF